jgi:hypothetical protein
MLRGAAAAAAGLPRAAALPQQHRLELLRT